jgi:hypothetical protein
VFGLGLVCDWSEIGLGFDLGLGWVCSGFVLGLVRSEFGINTQLDEAIAQ